MASPAYDVVVVGSGAGGGSNAWALARRGLRVLVLEAGPAYAPDRDYLLHTDGWEHAGFPHKVDLQGRQTMASLQLLQARWKDLLSWNRLDGPMNKGERRQSWGYHHVVGLGGSTLHFIGEAHRLHPAAMTMHSRFGVAADWPLAYADLEPWYVEAERVVGVAGPAADPSRPRSQPYPLPAHALSYASAKLAAGARTLGLHWIPNARAALSQPYDGRPPCNYCGNCMRGCPVRDKGSVDVTFLPKAVATGKCEIRTGARVIRVLTGPGDRIDGVEYLDAKGGSQRAQGRAYVIACGAVETPRLLLASANPRSPNGVANESGQVGKHFMETLSWSSAGLHPEPLGSHRGLPADSICWDFNAPDAIKGVPGGCRFTSGTAESDLLGPASYARRVVGGWGREHHQRMRQTFGRALCVGAIGESLPSAQSFVDLDPQARDTQGIPLARIHSHLDERELARLSFMAKTARQILAAAGVKDLFEEYGTYDAFSATHVFGTCRMGRDPRSSVVDAYCRSHRWRNLFVVDASVFPSSGGGESPSLTIEALALRSAEHLAALGRRNAL